MGFFNKNDDTKPDQEKGAELKRINGMRYLAGYKDNDRSDENLGGFMHVMRAISNEQGYDDSEKYYMAHIVFYEKKVEFRAQTKHNPEFDIATDQIARISVESHWPVAFLIIELVGGQEVVFATERLFPPELRAILHKVQQAYGLTTSLST